MKKKNPGIKRNIKFDENDLTLYMDIQIKEGTAWRRVKPLQAKELGGRKSRRNETLGGDELRSLVGSDSE